MDLRRFKAFMDLGRVQGVSTTAAVSMAGAMTVYPRWWVPFQMLLLVLISFFAHSGGAAVNELWDRKLDSKIPELSKKPLVSGIISVKEAKVFIVGTILTALALTFLMFGIPAFIAILISCIWLVWYCSRGKRTFLSYDFAFAVGYPAYALFGALAMGHPTVYTWIFMGIVATVAIFSQWDNGLKDANNDRKFGIPSFAVRWGVSSKKGLRPRDNYFLYGLGIKGAFLAICTVPIFLMELPWVYILVVFLIGYPGQLYVMWKFLGKQKRTDYVATILLDVPLSWLLGSAIVIPIAGPKAYVGLTLFVIAGYILGSLLQSGAEFKFMRYLTTRPTVG